MMTTRSGLSSGVMLHW